jgi:type I restriction enzyme S subunit
MPYSLLEAKPIEELCKVVDCEHKTAPYVDESDYLVVRTSNVRDGQLVMESMKYTTLEGYNEWTSRAVPEYGDVLFTREAPAGESCLVPSDTKVCMGQRMVMLRPHKSEVDPVFLSMILNTERTKNDIYRLSIGSTVSRINIADIRKLKVASPPLPEQRKIAKILSTWDKAISTTERLIENGTQQKKALMQQLLTGKKRLLDESGKAFEGEWEEVKLENVVIKTQLGTSERTKDVEETSTIPLIKMGNLTWGGFSFDKLETLPKSKVDESLILKSGDFLFNTRNTSELVGKSAIWKEQQVQATFDNNINRITFNQNINTDFMCLYLTYGKGKSLISSLSAGSTSVAAIYWKDLKNIKLPVPTLSEQQKIATILTNADKEIELLEQQLADLQQEKKALMQVLLTGKKRVLVDGELK